MKSKPRTNASNTSHTPKSILGSGRQKTRIWIAILVAALVIIGGGVFFRYSKASANLNRLVVLNTARAELGHQEWDARTLEYTGGVKDAWCAYFVSWVYKQSGWPMTASNNGRVPLAWKDLGVSVRQVFSERNAFHTPQKGGGYQALPGDVVVFGEERSHVGIVSEYRWTEKEYKLVAIEGNSNLQGSPDRVVERTYTSAAEANVLGFGNADAFITKSINPADKPASTTTGPTTAPAPAGQSG